MSLLPIGASAASSAERLQEPCPEGDSLTADEYDRAVVGQRFEHLEDSQHLRVGERWLYAHVAYSGKREDAMSTRAVRASEPSSSFSRHSCSTDLQPLRRSRSSCSRLSCFSLARA